MVIVIKIVIFRSSFLWRDYCLSDRVAWSILSDFWSFFIPIFEDIEVSSHYKF